MCALVRRGWRYSILSLEHNQGQTGEESSRVAAVLKEHGIEWTKAAYRPGARNALGNIGRLASAASRLVRTREIRLLHARSYLGAAAARLVKLTSGVGYIFDIRGYWLDEKLDYVPRRPPPGLLRAARVAERQLFSEAAAIVTLTRTAQNDIRSGLFGPMGMQRPVVCIPTCVDYGAFTLDGRAMRDPSALVLGQVGSLNPAYRTEQSFQLAARVLGLAKHARFMCLTSDREEALRLARKYDLPADRIDIDSCSHEDVSRRLQQVDWGFLMLTENFRLRGAIPTKLPEFIATGVRPIHHGGNPDIREWIERTGTGITVPELTGGDLDRAAHAICTCESTLSDLVHARETARSHFSLESGAERYSKLLSQLHASGSLATPRIISANLGTTSSVE